MLSVSSCSAKLQKVPVCTYVNANLYSVYQCQGLPFFSTTFSGAVPANEEEKKKYGQIAKQVCSWHKRFYKLLNTATQGFLLLFRALTFTNKLERTENILFQFMSVQQDCITSRANASLLESTRSGSLWAKRRAMRSRRVVKSEFGSRYSTS